MTTAMQGQTIWAATAGADLTGKLFHLVKMNSSEQIVLAGNGEAVLGVLVEEATSGNPCSVQLDGVAKVKLGAALPAGARIGANANGQANYADHGNYEAGTLLKGGNLGEIGSVHLNAGRAIP